MFKYTAIIYFGQNEIKRDSGDDLELLFINMLTQCQGQLGDLNGQIKDNRTHKIMKTFRTCAWE